MTGRNINVIGVYIGWRGRDYRAGVKSFWVLESQIRHTNLRGAWAGELIGHGISAGGPPTAQRVMKA
jgi:hypothetical protein